MVEKEDKEMKEYREHLEREASKFKLTPTDLSNLTDLGQLLPYWFVQGVLKPNKMKEWWLRFIDKVERITLEEKE